MKIYTKNPKYKELLKHYNKFTLVNNPKNAKVIVTDIIHINTHIYPNLQYVVCPCTNTDHVKFRRGVGCISLRNETKFLEQITSTAEHTIYLMLSLAKQTKELSFKRPKDANIRLSGKTLGIIGYGRVGKQVAVMAEGLGMKVRAYDIKMAGTEELLYLLRRSDFISLHASIKRGQKPIIDKAKLLWVKDGSFLINTARGEAIDEEALIAQLPRLGGFATDVLCSEDDPPNYKRLKKFDNVIITPHVGGYTKEDVETTFHFCMKKLMEAI